MRGDSQEKDVSFRGNFSSLAISFASSPPAVFKLSLLRFIVSFVGLNKWKLDVILIQDHHDWEI